MARISTGPKVKQRSQQLFAALLAYANYELEDTESLESIPLSAIALKWQTETHLIVKTKLRHLKALSAAVNPHHPLTPAQIREALNRWDDWLGILQDHRTTAQGSEVWHFSLHLWYPRQDRKANLQRYAQEWDNRRQGRQSLQPTAATVVDKSHSLQRQDWEEDLDVSLFYGRAEELKILSEWGVSERCKLLSILGLGGIGKSTLAMKFAQQVQGQFEVVCWRSLRNAPPLETLLQGLIPFLSNQQDHEPTPQRLLHWCQVSRCLLVFDNVETILQSGDLAGQYRPGYETYGELFRMLGTSTHQSLILLTSREKPANIAILDGEGLGVRSLVLSGSQEACLALISAKGLRGTSKQKSELGSLYGNSPLALKIVASSIQDLFDGDIAQFLSEETIVFNGIRRLLAQQFERLSKLEQCIMYWLAVNREWTTIATLAEDIIPKTPRAKLLESIESLTWRSLVEKQAGRYTQQPIVMEYVTEQLTQSIAQELLDQSLYLFYRHTLQKSTVQDFLRTSQGRLVIAPILYILKEEVSSDERIAELLQTTLDTLREDEFSRFSYGGGNVLNLAQYLNLDLTGYDCSRLSIWQAELQNCQLHQVDFTDAEFAQTTFMQTFSGVLSTAFSADGQLLATGDSNGQVRLWRVADGQLLRTFSEHHDWVRTVSFNADATVLASGSDEYIIILWNLKTGQLLRILRDHSGRVCTVQFSPDGHTLISSSEDLTVRLWDVYTGDCLKVLEGHTQQIWSVAFDPSGKTIVSGGEGNILKLWDVETGVCMKNFEGHRNWVWSVTFSPDGQYIASGSHDNTIKLWQVSTGKCLQTLRGHTNWIWSVRFAPQGSILASGSEDQTIRLWDVTTGRCLALLEGHHHRIWSLAFSPAPLESVLSAKGAQHQQAMLVSGSEDQSIRFWDISWSNPINGKESAQPQTLQSVISYCLRVLQGSSKQVWSVDFYPASQVVASGGDEQIIRLWNMQSGQCLRVLSGHFRRVTGLSFSPDGLLLASCSEDKTVRIWTIKTGQERFCLRGHTKQLWSTAFSPDGTLIASGGEDQTIRLWDVTSGKCVGVLEGHTNWVWHLAFSPKENILASASYDQTIKLWDIDSGTCIQTFEGHEGAIMGVDFSPDGQKLVSGSVYDQTLRYWLKDTGECLKILSNQSSMSVTCPPLTGNAPNRVMVVSVGMDGNFTIWHPELDEHHVVQAHSRMILDTAISSDGEVCVTASADETVRLWQMDAQECLKIFRPDRPYEGMNITGVKGMTEAQMKTLFALGAYSTKNVFLSPNSR